MELEELYKRFAVRIRRQAYFVLKDAYLGVDVCQEVLLKATAKRQEEIKAWWPWLKEVTRNTSIDMLRRSRRLHLTESVPDSPGESTDQSYERLRREELVQSALGRLPQLHQRLILLRYYGDRSYREIATDQAISETSVRDRLHYGLVLLRKELARLESVVALLWWRLLDRRREPSSQLMLVARVLEVAVVAAFTLSSIPSGILNAEEPETKQTAYVMEEPSPVARATTHRVSSQNTGASASQVGSGPPTFKTPAIGLVAPMKEHTGEDWDVQVGPATLSCGEPRPGSVMSVACDIAKNL